MNNTKLYSDERYFDWLPLSTVAGALWLASLHLGEAAEVKKFEPAQLLDQCPNGRPIFLAHFLCEYLSIRVRVIVGFKLKIRHIFSYFQALGSFAQI
jgi:hypothetical protein